MSIFEECETAPIFDVTDVGAFSVFLPNDYRPFFESLHSAQRKPPPRRYGNSDGPPDREPGADFTMQIAFGQNLEPWVVSAAPGGR